MSPTGGMLEIRLDSIVVPGVVATAPPELKPGLYARLTVRDTSHGMTPEAMEWMFDPFFTTKEVGQGTGLGLATVHRIITDHQGTITVASTPGQGTTFEVYLPQTQGTAVAQVSPAEPLLRGNECILLVDDEAILARLGQEVLKRLGYTVVAHTGSVKALQAFRATPQRFDLVITDQTMPGMSGVMLAAELRRIRPDIPVILCRDKRAWRPSGYSDVSPSSSKSLPSPAVARRGYRSSSRWPEHSVHSARGTSRLRGGNCSRLCVRCCGTQANRMTVGERRMKTVLLADDEAYLRLLVHTTLDDPAYRILEAADGHQALAMAQAEHPDLLVLDWMMPGLSGIVVAQTLRQDPAMAHIPIIMLTAKGQDIDRAQAHALGLQAYLVKPFSPLELLEKVQAILGVP
jgi:CheY-like chemotaxis protein